MQAKFCLFFTEGLKFHCIVNTSNASGTFMLKVHFLPLINQINHVIEMYLRIWQ